MILSRKQIELLPMHVRENLVLTDGCWAWMGHHKKVSGRPVFRNKFVYRILYELLIGPIPESLVLHHRVCNNKLCVNPWHTVPLTHSDHKKEHGYSGDQNIGQARKTHCPKGHPYAGENLFVTSKQRKCRICDREGKRVRYYKNIEESRKRAREKYQRLSAKKKQQLASEKEPKIDA